MRWVDGWHHRRDGHESEQALGVDDGQGSLVCCSPWGHKESDTTERLSYMCFTLTTHLNFSSVAQSCPTLCNLTDCSTPGFPVHHQLSELAQTPVHQVGDAMQPSHPLLSPSPPAFSLSQHQDFFQCVGSSHLMVKVLELQLQHQSFQ